MVVPNGEYVISDDSLINAQFEYCGETYGFVEGMTFEDVFCVYEESFQIKDGYLFSFVGLPVLNNETGLPVRVFDVVCVDGVYEKSDCPIDSTFTIYDGDQKQEFDYMFYMEAKWENLISSELSSEGFSIDADGIVVYGAAQRPLLYNGMVVRAEDLVCPLGAYTVENS